MYSYRNYTTPPSAQKYHKWTKVQNDKLIELWKRDFSYEEISARIGCPFIRRDVVNAVQRMRKRGSLHVPRRTQ